MRINFGCVLALAFFSAAISLAQNEPPKVELLVPKQAALGKKVQATVRMTFAPGLHAYQNPPSKDFMIPVTIKSSVKGIAAIPSYPKGEVKLLLGEPTAVYEGTVDIPVVLKIPRRIGTILIKLDVGFQQCTDQACDRPGSVPVTAKLSVTKTVKP